MTFLAPVLVLITLVGLGWILTRRWWLRDADVEQIRGLVVLLLVASSIAVAAVMVTAGALEPAARAAWSIGTTIFALGVASTNWTRRTLRWAGATALVLVSLMVLDIGRDQLALDPAAGAVEELEGMVAGLAALDEPASSLPVEADRQQVRDAIAAACAIARQEGVRADDIPDSVPCDDAPNGDALAVSLAVARLRLAVYRQAVLARDEDEEAVTTLTDALADAQATAGASGEDGASIVDAFRAGGEAIVADAPGQREGFPVTIEVLGWTLIAVLLLAGWRVVERRSGGQMPGPVTINPPGTAEPGATAPADAAAKADAPPDAAALAKSASATAPASGAPGDSKADGAEAQRTMFRTALLRNLPEPAAAPGADAFTSITDLAELSGGAATLLSKLADAIKGIITKPGGYVVSSDVSAPRKAGDEWTVLVRISDQTTGKQLTVKSVSGATASAACGASGFWAAADILSRSSRIPGWARWGPDAAESLALYHEVDKLSVTDLVKALARAPTSGLLLNELGNRYELDGRHLDALMLYARAVAEYPRFFVSRYRMAMSLGIVRSDIEKQWFDAPLGLRLSATGGLGRAFARLKLDATGLLNGQGLEQLPAVNDPVAAKAMLKCLTVRLLDRLEADAGRVQLLARALRRSERVIWWPRLLSIPKLFGAAAEDEWLIRSARVVEDDRDVNKVKRRALNPHSWWQLSYNLACYHAREGETEQAQHWLEVALERPGSGQMGGEWLKKDPDLKNLHGTPRFEWVVAQVSTK